MEDFYIFLESARRRLWLQRIARCAATGLVAGSAAALLAGLLLAIRPHAQAGTWMVSLAAAGLGCGVLAGLRERPSLAQAALAIDRRARLKDRVHTALQLSGQETLDAYARLQQRDAIQWLRRQEVRGLFPWRWPREGSWAICAVLASATAVLLVPRPGPAAAMPAGLPRAVQLEASALAEPLTALEEVLQRTDEEVKGPEGRQVVQRLRQMLEQMQEQARTPQEAMIQLARMTAAVQPSAAAFDMPLLRQALRDLGQGLEPLASFEPAAASLTQGRFDEAAQALEQLGRRIGSGESPVLRPGGLVEERLEQLARQAESAGLAELRDSLQGLHDAVQNGSRGESQAALSQLGRTIGRYGQRARLGQAMSRQLASLAQSRRNLAADGAYCKACREGSGPCRSEPCRGAAASTAATMQLSPSGEAGSAAAAQAPGDGTSLEVRLQPASLSGQPGEGDSDIETQRVTGASQSADTPYREVYARYHRIREQALAEEPLPLGHRQAIKRYFEQIHPDRVDDTTEPPP